MQESENVTGPGNGLIPLILVIALAIATAGGIWGLHKMLFVHPLNPLQPISAPAQAH